MTNNFMQINTTQVKYTKFFENHKLPNFTSEEKDNINNPILLKRLNLLLKAFGEKKSPDLDRFTGELYPTFKEEITTSLHNFF